MQYDAEREVLGDALISAEAHARIRTELGVDDFVTPKHQEIFLAMCRLYDNGRQLDAITLADELGAKLQNVGGVPYITEILLGAVSAANVENHIEILRTASRKRHFAIDIKAVYKAMQEDAEDYLDRAEEAIGKARAKTASKVEMVSDVVFDAYAEMFGRDKRGLRTGYMLLDQYIGGLYKGHICVVAGRPGMGKTTFAANIAANAAKEGKGVLFFSLEQPKKDIVKRLLISLSKCTEYDVMRDSPRVSNLVASVGVVTEWRLGIADDAFTLSKIREKCYAFRRQVKALDLVVVDYLGLVKTDRRSTREQEITELSRAFKLLARELDCPILLLSQLSRESEKRTDHKPVLSDIRDSGAIEQDADEVLFLYRAARYDSRADGKDAQIIIAKNRNGATGEIDVIWDGEHFTYSEPEHFTEMPEDRQEVWEV